MYVRRYCHAPLPERPHPQPPHHTISLRTNRPFFALRMQQEVCKFVHCHLIHFTFAAMIPVALNIAICTGTGKPSHLSTGIFDMTQVGMPLPFICMKRKEIDVITLAKSIPIDAPL